MPACGSSDRQCAVVLRRQFLPHASDVVDVVQDRPRVFDHGFAGRRQRHSAHTPDLRSERSSSPECQAATKAAQLETTV